VIDLLLKLAHDAMAVAAASPPRFYDARHLPPATGIAPLQDWRRELLRAARHDEHPWNAALLVEALVTNGARCWSVPRAAPAGRKGHSLHLSG
jgi:DNA polymerase-3 subunit delta'